MSGIYIPNMEMPNDCWDCPLIIEEESFSVCPQLARVIDDESKRPDDCHLIPVPDHKGPLIDVVELLDTFDDDYIFTNDQAKALLHYIISAESGDSG